MRALKLRFLLLGVCFLLAGVSWAQVGLRIDFGSTSQHTVWTAPDLSTGSDEGVTVDGGHYDFDGVLSDFILVRDDLNGNVAFKKARELKGDWRVVPSDYKLIAWVSVRVEHDGKPVANASVRVNGSAPKLIDKESDGTATFPNIQPGDVKVEVAFKSKGRDRITRQATEIKLDRSEVVPTIVVALQQDTETVAASRPAAPKSSEKDAESSTPKKEAPKADFFQQILTFVIAAGALAAAMYLGLKWVLRNEDKAQDALTKLGVPVQPMQDPDLDTPPANPTPAGPAPVQPIVLGSDAQVTPGSAPSSSHFAGQPPLAGIQGEPRLVLANGQPLPLPEGVSLVGREATCSLPLVGESTVSRGHAEIRREGNRLFVKDLGSTNGTFVNGNQISGEVEVRSGDRLQFGAVQTRLE